MFVRRFMVGLGFAGVLGCSSDRLDLDAQPPASAYAWGAVALEKGRLLSSTDLRPAGERVEFSADPDTEILVIAWEESGVRGALDTPVGSDALRIATPSDLSLPRPIAVWRLSDGQLTEDPNTRVPLLTRAAQNEGCAALSLEPIYVDSLCGEFRCVPRGERDGCLLRLEAGLCTFEQAVTMAVSPEGVALPTVEASPCVPGSGLDIGAPPTFNCSTLAPDCRFEVPAPTQRAQFSVERTKVADPILASNAHQGREAAEPWNIGNPYEIAVSTDSLFILQVEDDTQVTNFSCSGRGPARLSRRPIDDFATVTSSRSLSNCVDGLTVSGPDQLLLVSMESSGVFLIELGFDLRERRRLLLGPEAPDGSRATALVASMDGRRALIFLEEALLAQNRPNPFYANRWLVDLAGFSLLLSGRELGNWNSYGGAALPSGNFAIASSGDDVVFILDPELHLTRSVERVSIGSLWLFRPVYDPAAETLFVPVAGAGSIFSLRGRDYEARGAHAIELHPAEIDHQPTTVLPSVFGPGRGVAAVAYVEGEGSARRHKSALVPFDSFGPRIPLGRFDLGEGKVANLLSDGRGAAIALLPWTGEILRIRLVEP